MIRDWPAVHSGKILLELEMLLKVPSTIFSKETSLLLKNTQQISIGMDMENFINRKFNVYLFENKLFLLLEKVNSSGLGWTGGRLFILLPLNFILMVSTGLRWNFEWKSFFFSRDQILFRKIFDNFEINNYFRIKSNFITMEFWREPKDLRSWSLMFLR